MTLGPLPQITSKPRSVRYTGFNWYDHRANAIWIGDVTAETRARIVAHELSHFLIHVSTPYGWLLDEINDLQTRLVSQYCFETYQRQPHRTILTPVYEVAVRLRAQDARVTSLAFADLCERFVRPWSFTRYLENLLEGEDLPEVAAATHRDALDALEWAERRSDVQGWPAQPTAPPFLDAYVAQADRLPATNFMNWHDGTRFQFGAKHVFEGAAKQLERISQLEQADFVGGNRPDYWALWLFAVTRLGAKQVQSQRDYERLRDTFFALCDLALFVPAGRLYGQLRTETTIWADLQPGWRFTVAIDEAAKLGWIEDLERDIFSYQDQICSVLGWPSPREFLKIGASQSIDSPEARRHAQACSIRLKTPIAFIDLDREMNRADPPIASGEVRTPVGRFFVDHFPLVYRSDSGEMIVRNMSGGVNEPLHLLIVWFLARFNEWVMLRGTFKYQDLLPDRVEYGNVFGNVKTLEDFVNIIKTVHPIYTPERFELV